MALRPNKLILIVCFPPCHPLKFEVSLCFRLCVVSTSSYNVLQSCLLTILHRRGFINQLFVTEMGSNPGTAASEAKQTLMHKRWVPLSIPLLLSHTHKRTHTHAHKCIYTGEFIDESVFCTISFTSSSLCTYGNWTNKLLQADFKLVLIIFSLLWLRGCVWNGLNYLLQPQHLWHFIINCQCCTL